MLQNFRLVFGAIACVAAMTALTAPATAETITYSGYSVDNNTAVTLNYPPGSINEGGGSGEIHLNVGPPFGSVGVWCVDIFHYLQWSGSFTVNPVFPIGGGLTNVDNMGGAGGSYLTVDQLGDIGALVYHGDVDSTHSSAYQIAIWEIEYGSNLIVTGGDTALVNTLVNDAENVWAHNFDLVWLTQAGVDQGQITNQGQIGEGGYCQDCGTNGFPAPEPVSLSVFGAGLAGAVTMRRRKPKAA